MQRTVRSQMVPSPFSYEAIIRMSARRIKLELASDSKARTHELSFRHAILLPILPHLRMLPDGAIAADDAISSAGRSRELALSAGSTRGLGAARALYCPSRPQKTRAIGQRSWRRPRASRAPNWSAMIYAKKLGCQPPRPRQEVARWMP
jgi:hypothetical protein